MSPATTTTTAATTTTTPATTTTTGATTTKTTASTTTTAPATTTASTTPIFVVFRSIQSNFTTDLLNSSSEAFKTRAGFIKAQIEPPYRLAFPSSFVSLNVVSFRQGSVINTIELRFVNTSVPNN
ncbi:endochitinase A-like, partial [Neolamprologus brichardi]|uniref:endochitinase A-like n=1 Tax=Neolamprologus brichardi TaxID=32507 RepID=UPI00164380C6